MLDFPDLPLKRKLTLIIMLTSTAAMLLGGAASVTYELTRYRQDVDRDLSTLAEMIGINTAAALAFHNAPAARDILAVLRSQPEITHACLYATDGRLVAEYRAPQADRRPMPAPPPPHWYDTGDLVLCRPISLGAEPVGRICLRSDLRGARVRMVSYGIIAAAVVLAALFLALVLSHRLQRIVSDPILALARVARSVTARPDSSLRATAQSNDEIGELTVAFNQMLAQIQQRDATLEKHGADLQRELAERQKVERALRASEERFRQLAESITEVFWLTNVEKTRMIYISPGYERIWGRTCESLYQQPSSWLEAVHSDDRERVWHLARIQQETGAYDEEYRIVRPDGTVRWVRDRAFPVRDDAGTVYRIAGIADDITERKHLEKGIMEISDREQQRIGQDLHDGLCQHLTATLFAGKVLEEKLAEQSLAEAAEARQLGEYIRLAIGQARDIAHGLDPVIREPEGLMAALAELATGIEHTSHVPCRFCGDPPVLVGDATAAMHLYRIAQEAVSNAVRHARPEHIVISLTANDGPIVLAVEDDGVGLPNGEGPPPGMGLRTMQYRASLIGARLEMQRRSPRGTAVRCTLPRPTENE